MRVHISLDLTLLNNATFSSVFYLEFDNITDLTNWHDEEETERVSTLEFNNGSTDKTIYVFIDGATSPTYDQRNDLYELADVRDEPLTLECDIPDNMRNRFWEFVQLGIISVIEPTGKTTLYLFKQNSPNDESNKTLTLIDVINGKFNHSIAVKLINIDVIDYNVKDAYNYIFIPSLNRYYYVDSTEIISGDYVRLHLKEDVLMSWRVLIKSQSAFVTRYEKSANVSELFDERRPMADKIKLIDFTSSLTNTPLVNSFVNCTLDFSNDGANPYPNIMVVTYSTELSERIYNNTYIKSPSGSGLPRISTQLNGYEWVSFITPFDLNKITHAYYSDDAVSSYIESVIWLPFDPTTPFSLVGNGAIYVRNKYIDENGNYQDTNSTVTKLSCHHVNSSLNKSGICPYLIIKDFSCPNISLLSDREPHTNYEFFIPFVGWVKVDSSRISNIRILIYYTMDLKSGISTAYIYNYTQQFVIWSGTCQLGVKIDMTTSNLIENTKQKQANDLNMILGMLSSAVSFGVGVVSENPVAIMGGVLSAGKTIAGYVNSNNQIFERSQMSFGSANGSLYTNLEFKCIKATHELLDIDVDIYKHMQGLPYNNYVSLSNLTGYVEIGEIHFNPMEENIYQDEIQEIVSLLKDGVIF